MNQQKFPLPNWAKNYRIFLMVFDLIVFLNASVFIVFAFFPSGFTTSNPNKAVPWLIIFAGLFFLVFLIPYLLSNLIYLILWFLKIKGKYFSVSRGSSAVLVAIPVLITVIILLVYLPAVIK